jgi:tetratricopeptide (TPR) repeat protein
MIHVLILLCTLWQAPVTQDSFTPEVLNLLQSGVNAKNRNDLDEAISAFRKATDVAPGATVAFFRLGEAYMRKRDYAAAIPPLKRAVELSPDLLPAHQLLGFALLTQGYAAEAIPHFELVHEYAVLGIAQLQAGQPAEAVANLQAAVAKSPNDPDLLYYLSRAAVEQSSQSLDKLLSNFPDSARAHGAKGRTFYQMKMYPEAAVEYEKGFPLRSDLPELRLELGQIYSASSDWVKAEQEFRAETQSQPGNAEAAYRLGDVLLQQGKMQEAAEELRRSNELRPDMPETLYSLGKALAVADPAQAERALNRVVAMEKDTLLAGSAYLALAAIQRKQGKTELAAKEMQEYRRIQDLYSLQPRHP